MLIMSQSDSIPKMMSVYNFSRSDSEIKDELLCVFSSGRGTAREHWSAQAELIVEPVGWDALWKLSKQFCKKFEVRFPCIAFVTVVSVDFEALSACVDILSVQHEAVTLPESVEDVPLIELWPTIQQREKSINEATTADFIDLLRFYYTNIWMPWDDQDGKVVLPKTIEDRLQLWTELRSGAIPACVARSITLLRTSAINAYETLQELDSSLCDVGLTDEDDSLLPPSLLARCAELTARLDALGARWPLYEDARVREARGAQARARWLQHKAQRNAVALWQGGSISEFEEISKFLRRHVSGEHVLSVHVSAEAALAAEPELLLVCSPSYELPEMPLSNISMCSFKGATLTASDMRSCLLTLSEECALRDLTLQCALVSTAVVMRAGSLHVVNCTLGDSPDRCQSDFAQGIIAMSGSKILIENSTFENFYTGIVVHRGAQVELRNCCIKNCGVGIQMYSGAEVVLQGTAVRACAERSLRCDVDRSAGRDPSSVKGLQIMPDCRIGSGDFNKEILVVPQDVNLL